MQQNQFLEWLYNNWLDIFLFMVVIVVVLTITVLFFVRSGISTKVLMLKKNTIEELKAKEDPDASKIRVKGRILLRKTDPYILKRGVRIFRVFFAREGAEQTVDLPFHERRPFPSLSSEELEALSDDDRTKYEEKKEAYDKKHKAELDDRIEWSTIFESEAIKQGVAGMLASKKMSLITLAAGAFLGMFALTVIQALAGG